MFEQGPIWSILAVSKQYTSQYKQKLWATVQGIKKPHKKAL